MGSRLITFIKEARQELKKVSWPTRQQTIRYTVAVIVMSLTMAVFLGGLDLLFQFILEEIVTRSI